jgi:hypothetical protein
MPKSVALAVLEKPKHQHSWALLMPLNSILAGCQNYQRVTLILFLLLPFPQYFMKLALPAIVNSHELSFQSVTCLLQDVLG